MEWYIDSWAVVDGLAFASRRPADSLGAEATVFLSVPDLEPIPVGRISTALRAQRASFQDGFRDADGNELAFDTLDQVREVVRRAYLGGGLGPAPIAIDAPPADPLLREAGRPPEEPPPRQGGGFLEEELDRLGAEPAVPLDYGPLQHPDGRRNLLEALHQEDATARLYPYLQAFGAATLLEFLHARWESLHLPGERETLGQWARLLMAIGLWDSPEEFRKIFAGMPELARYLLERAPFFRTLVASRSLLFRIPCPLRAGWSRHIHALGDKLLLPLVDRYYFASNRDLPEFIPLLFCSLVITVTPALAVDTFPSLRSGDRHRLLGRALWWLARELPHVTLPDAVEQQLSDFAWTRLEQNPPR